MINSHTIIFLGPQGSGKGTQAQLLIPKINAEYVEMGALLRHIAAQDSDFGRQIKSEIDKGILISDQELESILNDILLKLDPDKAVIFDGVPRKLGQAEWMLDYLHRLNRNEIITLELTLSRADSIKRLNTRMICENCRLPAIAIGESQQVCKHCGGKLIHRADDTPEAINKRLDLYEQETMPVIDYLKTVSKVITINGAQAIEKVQEDVCQALNVESNQAQTSKASGAKNV